MSSSLSALRHIIESFPALEGLPPGVFVVGGAVRDALLGLEPIDADLTAAGVESIARDFAIQHGSRVVELGRDPLIVLRVVLGDRIYDFVEMTGASIEEDLRRRDFTMNALAAEAARQHLIDPTGGAADIEQKLVRMVSEQNFIDDPLRIVKAVRMAVKYRFEIERETLVAMQRNAARVADVAAERVLYEMRAVFSEDEAPRGARLMLDAGLDRIIFGRPLTEGDPERIRAAGAADADLALALLLKEDEVEAFAGRWKLSASSRESILGMHRFAQGVTGDQKSIPIALFDAGRRLSEQGVAFLRGMGDTKIANSVSEIMQRDGGRIFAIAPLLTGDEIAEATGLAPGRELGRVKRAMVEAQVRNEVEGRDQALEFVRRLSR